MRVVHFNDALFRRGGVGSGDAAAIAGYHRHRHEHVLVAWGKKRFMLDTQELKAMRKVPDLDQGTPEWHRFRKLGVGGSEVGTLVGNHRFKDPLALYGEKTATDYRGEQEESEDVQRGKRDEPVARERYEDLFGVTVTPVCVIHDEWDHVRASLDGLRAGDDLLIEVKCPRPPGHKKNVEIAAEEDPQTRHALFERASPWYWAQVQYQMIVTGLKKAHFVSYCGAMPKRHQQIAVAAIDADPEYQEALLERVHRFWYLVENRIPPGLGEFGPIR